MKLNRDDVRRREIFAPFVSPDKPSGGITRFNHLNLEALKQLIDENFADPTERQNDSPSIQEFYDFMEKHPGCGCHGYFVDIERSDYRVSLEGIIFGGKVTIPLLLDFASQFRSASEFEVDVHYLYCWWD